MKKPFKDNAISALWIIFIIAILAWVAFMSVTRMITSSNEYKKASIYRDYENGFNSGYEEGYIQGEQDGYDKGYTNGYEAGLSNANN